VRLNDQRTAASHPHCDNRLKVQDSRQYQAGLPEHWQIERKFGEVKQS